MRYSQIAYNDPGSPHAAAPHWIFVMALTICTVIHRHLRLLELNWRLTSKMNPSADFQWLVVDNRPEDAGKPLPFGSDRVQLAPGIALPESIPQQVRPSYHHARAFNEALSRIKTRYVLFLDPDYYIVRPDWINAVLRHMESNGIAFFGSPYHPKNYEKYRYFPCGFCLFVDLELVARETLDFEPEYDLANMPTGWEIRMVNQTFADLRKRADKFSPAVVAVLDQALKLTKLNNLYEDRQRILAARDTGYKIYRQYAHNPATPSECLIPVYRLPNDFAGPNPPFGLLTSMLERELPDDLSFIPKRPGYFTARGFKEFGAPDAASVGWEEALWQDEPFGFHTHGSTRKRLTWPVEDQVKFLEELLRHFCPSISFDELAPMGV